MEYHIVWNEAKTEGFVTTDKQLAYEVRKGAENNCLSETRPQRTSLGAAFVDLWGHGNCTIETVIKPTVATDGDWVSTEALTEVEAKSTTTLLALASQDPFIGPSIYLRATGSFMWYRLNGELVAFIIPRTDLGEHRRADMPFVKAEFRRCGIISSFIRGYIAKAPKARYRAWINDENVASTVLYQSLGFVRTGKTKVVDVGEVLHEYVREGTQ